MGLFQKFSMRLINNKRISWLVQLCQITEFAILSVDSSAVLTK